MAKVERGLLESGIRPRLNRHNLKCATELVYDSSVQMVGLSNAAADAQEPKPKETASMSIRVVNTDGETIFNSDTASSLKDALAQAAAAGASLRGANLRYEDLERVQAPGLDLSHADLSCAQLQGASLAGANFTMAILNRTDLEGADLSGAQFPGTILRQANMAKANLRNADLRNADLRNAALAEVNIEGADLEGADLRNADLRGLGLNRLDMGVTMISGAELRVGPRREKPVDYRNDFSGSERRRTERRDPKSSQTGAP